MAKIAEQISAYEAKRAANEAAMEALVKKSEEDGSTFDAKQQEEFDGLYEDNVEIDGHLKRLRIMQDIAVKKAAVVPGNGEDETRASASRSPSGQRAVVVGRNVEKGIVFARVLGAKYLAQQNGVTPVDVAKSKFGDTPEVEMILRAPVNVGTTTDSTWAAPLVQLNQATSEFIELLRAATIIGRIPGLRRVPFNVQIPRATGDPSVNWVGEGKVKPVSAMAFDSITLRWNKVAGIVPITEELMKFSNPAADTLVRDALVAAIAYLTDRDFLDPTKTATDVSPASVTQGVTPIVASGTTADALRADLGRLLAAYLVANMSVSGLVLVMTSVMAMRLSLMRNALDQKEFPDINMAGGTLEGIPVIVSENIVAANGSPGDGGLIVALNAPEILLAEEGVSVDVSREASLQMETTPDSPATASTVLVSLWQHNMVGIRAERYITWLKRRAGAVQYINGANYS